MKKVRSFHPWNVTPQDAMRIQQTIRTRVIRKGKLSGIRLVAGADVAFDTATNTAFAGVVILELPNLRLVESEVVKTAVTFPYIPGLLSFREIPPLLKAFHKLRHEPDLIMVDGHGISHPREAGLACHIGVILDRPVIGCAKSVLVGSYDIPGNERGSVSELRDKAQQIIGAVVRTRDGVKPVFVSIGHRIGLEDAIRFVLACGKGFRIPEPTRLADLIVGKVKRKWE